MHKHTRNSEVQDTHSPLSTESIHQEPEIQPPFLVRTKTREEKDSMRQQLKKQEANGKRPYDWLQKFYARFSTSFMLENKAATARDHLGK